MYDVSLSKAELLNKILHHGNTKLNVSHWEENYDFIYKAGTLCFMDI